MSRFPLHQRIAKINSGKLFIEFALTLAGAVLVSGFVALTLSPMMCSKLLRQGEKHGWLFNLGERVLRALDRGNATGLLRPAP